MSKFDIEHNIRITKAAAAQLKYLAIQKGIECYLRVSVLGGGCAGLQYKFEITGEKGVDDIIVSQDDQCFLFPLETVPFVKDCVVDFVETLGEASFIISNPNETSKCGCGNSFNV